MKASKRAARFGKQIRPLDVRGAMRAMKFSGVYDRKGRKIGFARWGQLFERWPYKRVAKTGLGDGVNVSTVWLGIDNGWGDTERPEIFETMVFGGPMDLRISRYGTERDARRGHNRVVNTAQELQSKGW